MGLGTLIGLLSVACGGRSIVDDGGRVDGAAGASNAGGGSNTGTIGVAGAQNSAAGDASVAGGSCSAPSACGGNLTGNWLVVSSCLQISGQLDVSILGLGCSTAAVTGYREVRGTWSALADGTYLDATTTTGVDQIQLAPACLSVSGTSVPCAGLSPIFTIFGYGSVSCQGVATGACSCSARAAQSGGLGVVIIDPRIDGRFTTSGNVVTVDGRSPYSYCASPGKLTLTPQSANPTITGSIELARP